MKSLTEEKYVFYRICTGDIQECVKTLEMLEHATSESMRVALIKASIVSYARPFSGNQSVYKHENKKLRLDKKYIPKNFIETHDRAIELRDKLIAHSDIPYRNPELLKSTSHFAIGYNMPLNDAYMEFSKALYTASTALLKNLWDLTINYEKEIR